MSMVNGVLDEGKKVESFQKEVLKESNFWPKKRALFLFQENQETLHEHSTLVGLTPNFTRVIGMMCRNFAPKFIKVSVPKRGVVLRGPLLGCGGDGYGGALLARENSLSVVSFFFGDGLR